MKKSIVILSSVAALIFCAGCSKAKDLLESLKDDSTPAGESTAASEESKTNQDTGLPSNAKTLTYDFGTMTAFGNMTNSSTTKAASGTATYDNREWNYVNASFHGSDDYNPSPYLALYAKEAKKVAMFGNITAFGNVLKVSFTVTSSCSDTASFVIDFGSQALGVSSETSGTQITKSGANEVSAPSGTHTHFAISSVNDSEGKLRNLNIATLTVVYTD